MFLKKSESDIKLEEGKNGENVFISYLNEIKKECLNQKSKKLY